MKALIIIAITIAAPAGAFAVPAAVFAVPAAARDTIYMYETEIVYDTIIVRDTLRIRRTPQPTVEMAHSIPAKNILPPGATFSQRRINIHENYNQTKVNKMNRQTKSKNMKMKKMNAGLRLCTAIVAAQFFGGAYAQNADRELTHYPLQIGFAYPVTTQLRATVDYTYPLSLNVLTGRVGGVNGIAASGIFHTARQAAHGIQLAGIGNTAGSVTGVQAAGIMNVTKQLRGGAQFAGITNIAHVADGAQFAGIANVADSANAQFAGIANVTGEVAGVAMAGIVNRTGTLSGFLLAPVNIVDSVASGVPVGVITIVRKGGFHEWAVSLADYQNVGVSYKIGVEQLYSILNAGASFADGTMWSAGFGVGCLRRINHRFAFQPEIMSYEYFPDNFKWAGDITSVHLRAGFVYKLSDRAAISIAPSVFATHQHLPSGENTYSINRVPAIWTYQEGMDHLSIGVGVSASFIFR